MTVRALQPDYDIVTSGQHFISGKVEVGQTIQTRLHLFLGEYFRNVLDGTDWFGKVLTKAGDLAVTDATVRQRIRETDGVNALLSFSSEIDIDTRLYTVTCAVLTDHGVLELQTEGLGGG